jgi:hypothetical protein
MTEFTGFEINGYDEDASSSFQNFSYTSKTIVPTVYTTITPIRASISHCRIIMAN